MKRWVRLDDFAERWNRVIQVCPETLKKWKRWRKTVNVYRDSIKRWANLLLELPLNVCEKWFTGEILPCYYVVYLVYQEITHNVNVTSKAMGSSLCVFKEGVIYLFFSRRHFTHIIGSLVSWGHVGFATCTNFFSFVGWLTGNKHVTTNEYT